MSEDTSNVEKGSLLEEQHMSVETFILTLTLGGNMTSFWPDYCPENLTKSPFWPTQGKAN